MGTQGVVSVVRGGKVVGKVAVGCNGMKAKGVATAIAGSIPARGMAIDGMFIEFLKRISLENLFGCESCLTAGARGDPAGRLMGLDHLMEEGEDVLFARWSETFRIRRFNPRWDQGSADHVWIANLDTGRAYRSRSGTPLRRT